MARNSVDRLKDRIDELEAENEVLQDQVDSIADILEPEDDEGSINASLRCRLAHLRGIWRLRREHGTTQEDRVPS